MAHLVPIIPASSGVQYTPEPAVIMAKGLFLSTIKPYLIMVPHLGQGFSSVDSDVVFSFGKFTPII